MNCYHWHDLAIGMNSSFIASFREESATVFAGLSGDINPLHVDYQFAVSKGYKGPVLFGMLTSSLYSRLVGVYLPGKFALLQGMDLDFYSPCYANDELIVQGEIIHLLDAYRRIEIRASIRKVDQRLISKAVIRVGMHD
jgi:3-hydroxybutyryl-CoA dehydratase